MMPTPSLLYITAMSTNSRFAVAVHALTYVAMHAPPVSSKDIAESVGTNPAFIRRIICDLHTAGLVETHMGISGGISLRHPPEAISLLAVYCATKQNPSLTLHQSTPNDDCLTGRMIHPVLGVIFDEAETALRAVLAQRTLADVVADVQTPQLAN